MKRVLFPHGFGDCIQALPALRRYAAKLGDDLEVGVLGRLPACRQVMEAQDFVARVFDLEDPWRDFRPKDTAQGYALGMRCLEAKHGGVMVWTNPRARPTDPAICKGLRVALELGVADGWVPENPWPCPTPHRAYSLFGMVHGQAGNAVKDVRPEALEAIGSFFVPPGTRFSDLAAAPFEDVERLWLSLHGQRLFVGVDSGPAHLASCTTVPVVWVFKSTPIQQAVPLWRPVRVVVVGPRQDQLVASWDAWRAANPSLVPHEVSVSKGDPHA